MLTSLKAQKDSLEKSIAELTATKNVLNNPNILKENFEYLSRASGSVNREIDKNIMVKSKNLRAIIMQISAYSTEGVICG